MKNSTLVVLFIFCTAILGGCNMAPSSLPTLSAENYLQMAANSYGTERQQLQLQAASRYIDAGHISNAQTLLNDLSQQPMPSELIVKHQLLQARIYISKHNNTQAIRLLNQLAHSHLGLTHEQHIQQLQLAAIAYEQQRDIIASIQQRTQLLSLEPTGQQKETLIAIWLSLQTVSPQKIDSLNDPSLPRYIQGWFDLNDIINNSTHSDTPIVILLADWQHRFPGHPANVLLPKNIATPETTQQAPHHIALLLPLSGEYAPNAEAIRNGFFTAYYYAKQHTSNPPTVTVLDTSQSDVGTAYRTAIQQGADFVVGPLTKKDVADLSESQHISVPTLALNTLPNTRKTKNLYQFGLSPFDEASQLVGKAQQAQHSRVLIIAPQDTWGQDIAQRLTKQWEERGGQVTATLNYTARDKLSNDIKQLLNVNDSYSRGYAIRSILHTKHVRIVSRRRQDFDSIFLIAQPAMARQIQPLLQFYFAGNVPVYASSQLYDGHINTSSDRDLNNVFFCDMPWVLEPQHMHPEFLNTLQQQSQNVWPKSYQDYTKFYALGVDAYQITTSLNTMQLLPDFGTKAATGTLYLDENNHIFRQLLWAQFINGKPKLVS